MRSRYTNLNMLVALPELIKRWCAMKIVLLYLNNSGSICHSAVELSVQAQWLSSSSRSVNHRAEEETFLRQELVSSFPLEGMNSVGKMNVSSEKSVSGSNNNGHGTDQDGSDIIHHESEVVSTIEIKSEKPLEGFTLKPETIFSHENKRPFHSEVSNETLSSMPDHVLLLNTNNTEENMQQEPFYQSVNRSQTSNTIEVIDVQREVDSQSSSKNSSNSSSQKCKGLQEEQLYHLSNGSCGISVTKFNEPSLATLSQRSDTNQTNCTVKISPVPLEPQVAASSDSKDKNNSESYDSSEKSFSSSSILSKSYDIEEMKKLPDDNVSSTTDSENNYIAELPTLTPLFASSLTEDTEKNTSGKSTVWNQVSFESRRESEFLSLKDIPSQKLITITYDEKKNVLTRGMEITSQMPTSEISEEDKNIFLDEKTMSPEESSSQLYDSSTTDVDTEMKNLGDFFRSESKSTNKTSSSKKEEVYTQKATTETYLERKSNFTKETILLKRPLLPLAGSKENVSGELISQRKDIYPSNVTESLRRNQNLPSKNKTPPSTQSSHRSRWKTEPPWKDRKPQRRWKHLDSSRKPDHAQDWGKVKPFRKSVLSVKDLFGKQKTLLSVILRT